MIDEITCRIRQLGEAEEPRKENFYREYNHTLTDTKDCPTCEELRKEK